MERGFLRVSILRNTFAPIEGGGPVNIGKRLVEALAIAIVYIAAAQLGFLVAIPPGNVTVVWPPSGIALTAMLLLGYRAWAGIWLGSFLVNGLFFVSANGLFATAATAASSIAAGSTLQALLAAFLYRHVIGSRIPQKMREIFIFTTLAALSCLVAATFGASSLAFAGAIAWANYTYTWVTWWLGDLAGMLTVAPLLLFVGYKAQQRRNKRQLSFLLISIGTGLSLIACYNVWHIEDQVVTTYLGVNRAWLFWGVLATGLLLTALLAAYVERYLWIESALHESEERSRRQLLELETLYRTAPIGLGLVDRDLRFLRINEKLAEIDGMSVDAHIGRTLREVVPGVVDTIEPLYRRVIETGEPVLNFEVHGTTAAQPGVERDWLVDYYPLKGLDGSVQAVGAIVVETTERKRAEEALYEEKERAQITLASIGDGVVTTDAAGRVEFLNPAAEHLLGWSNAEAQGVSLTEIFHLVDETTREPVQDPVQSCLCLGKITGFANPAVLIRRDGEELTIDDSAAPIRARDGRIVGAVIIFRDVTAQRQLAQQLTYQATHDALTGLVNRQEFERRLELMLKHAKQQHRRHVLCYLDLDQFKVVNDTCGHIAGDELLRQLSALLKTRMRERDTLARLGGDEFGVLLGECPLDQAVRIANQLRELIQDFRFVWQDKSFSVGVSIGLAPIAETSSDPPSLLSAADSACFAAKERGRNLVHVYQPGDSYLEQRRDEMRWITQLHQTLVHDRLCLYYQPIVSLSTTEGAHGEILLRLKDEQGRTLLPGAFILAAERYNQMLAIDRWVVRSTLAALWGAPALASITYSINLSGQSLGNAEFLHFVMEELDRTSVAPSQICFEITETAAIANLSAAMNFISILKEKGCCFALDDFGSGLSSFAYLKTLPVDFLKIDGRFVKDMINDPIDCAMVEAIHHVGHLMGIKTIAEWVENEIILKKLKAIGVDYAQGFGITKPRPFLEAREAL